MMRTPALMIAAALLAAGCRFDASGALHDDGDGGGAADAVAPGDGAIVDAAAIDAAPGDAAVTDAAPVDAGGCPAACDSCDVGARTCAIDCGGNQCADGVDVTCPVGWTCQVGCIGDNACRNGPVSCAGDCEITCMGAKACEKGQVSCVGTSCAIDCVGADTCDSAVRCNALSCDVTCSGDGACEDLGVCCAGESCGAACTASNGGSCACD